MYNAHHCLFVKVFFSPLIIFPNHIKFMIPSTAGTINTRKNPKMCICLTCQPNQVALKSLDEINYNLEVIHHPWFQNYWQQRFIAQKTISNTSWNFQKTDCEMQQHFQEQFRKQSRVGKIGTCYSKTTT